MAQQLIVAADRFCLDRLETMSLRLLCEELLTTGKEELMMQKQWQTGNGQRKAAQLCLPANAVRVRLTSLQCAAAELPTK
uniref:Uncharacterized protein n=1 Tax=Oryza meridionalis TaxID=40149 RepID=A0A0E0F7N0_9ORYZ